MTEFKYSDGSKLYHSLDYYFKNRFDSKVFKVPLNAGFTCPNIDGTKGVGGCTYCSESGSGDFAGNPADSLARQFDTIVSMMHKKWKTTNKYMPYFQAHTNTYAPVSVLKECFEPFIGKEGVVGLDIATRSDALADDVLDYLETINSRCELIVELGLQSVFNETGSRINRCMTYSEFLDGYYALKNRGIKVCIHLINGLPGESESMMITSAKKTAALRPEFVKLHLLHVLKNTRLEAEYQRGELQILTQQKYIDVIIRQLELLPPETVIARLTGDGARSELIAPLWSLKKFEVLNEIDRQMKERGTYQGRLWTE